jgi:hypothetical protein
VYGRDGGVQEVDEEQREGGSEAALAHKEAMEKGGEVFLQSLSEGFAALEVEKEFAPGLANRMIDKGNIPHG